MSTTVAARQSLAPAGASDRTDASVSESSAGSESRLGGKAREPAWRKLFPAVARQLPALDVSSVHDDRLFAVDAWRWARSGLVLLGPTGIGKSSSALRLVARLCEEALASRERRQVGRANAIVWQSALVLSRETALRNERLLARSKAASLLVLDDLGFEVDVDRTRAIAECLSSRYDAGRPTIVTTALTLSGIEERYTASLVRRLCESGGTEARIIDCWPKSDVPRSNLRMDGVA